MEATIYQDGAQELADRDATPDVSPKAEAISLERSRSGTPRLYSHRNLLQESPLSKATSSTADITSRYLKDSCMQSTFRMPFPMLVHAGPLMASELQYVVSVCSGV
jgi:hypothetical protein